MRTFFVCTLLIAVVVFASSCNNSTGCIEATADNFNAEAKKDDGTCIPSRDKLIGNYTYTRMWKDVLTSLDSTDFGSFQLTEANTGLNEFNTLFNGWQIIQGSTNASDIAIKPFDFIDSIYWIDTVFVFTRDFTGVGFWLEKDSVDMHLEFTTRVPKDDGTTWPWPTVPQTYHYYCTKAE